MRKVAAVAETASLPTGGPYVHDAKVDKEWLESVTRGYPNEQYGYIITDFQCKVFEDGRHYTTAILSHYGPDEEAYPGVPIRVMAWNRR